MRFRDNIVSDRQPEPGALTRRLGGEKRLKQLVHDTRRNAGAIVAHADFHGASNLARRDRQRRLKAGVRGAACSLTGGIKSVAEQVQEGARHVLRVHLDRGHAFAEVPFQGDVEALILRTCAVVGEVQCLIDQRVQINHTPFGR